MIQVYRKLLRVQQWYKNLIAFVPMTFSDTPWTYSALAFLGLCCVSSVSYIYNDWRDREEDKLHPTKKFRPLASGEINGTMAIVVVCILLGIDIFIASRLGMHYAVLIGTYLVASTGYSLGLKHIPLLDIFLIGFNFMVRMAAGINDFANSKTLPYFVFFFCLILMFLSHKRRSDNKLLGDRAARHKPVLKFYTDTRCYGIRFFMYAVMFAMLLILENRGVIHMYTVISILCLLVTTSTLFSIQPRLCIKPHYLLRIWYWDILLVVVISTTFL